MITLTRPLARQVRAVFRHALGTSPRGPCPAVSLRADQRGLTIRLKSGMTAIERSVPGEYSDGKQILVGRRSVLGRSGAPTMAESSDGLGSVGKGPLWPTLQGRSDQVVSIERQWDGDLLATWHDVSVPVVMRYTHPDAAELADGGHENWDRHRLSVIGASPIFARVDDRQSGIAADGAAGCQRNDRAGFDLVRARV